MSSMKGESEIGDSLVDSVATEADIPELIAVVNLAYRGGKASVGWKNEHHLVQGPRIIKEDLEKYIADKDSAILLTRSASGELIGTVHIERHGQDAHIGMLSVHPEHQNIGLGKKLLLLAEEYSSAKFKCTNGKMFVFAGREELLSWYKKMGYELSGETMPFFGPESGLTPLVENAHFVVVAKRLPDLSHVEA